MISGQRSRDADAVRARNFRGIWWAIDGLSVKKCAVDLSDVALSHRIVALSAEIDGGRYSCLFLSGRLTTSRQHAVDGPVSRRCTSELSRHLHGEFSSSTIPRRQTIYLKRR